MSHPPNKSIPPQYLTVGQQVWVPVNAGSVNHVTRTSKEIGYLVHGFYRTPDDCLEAARFSSSASGLDGTSRGTVAVLSTITAHDGERVSIRYDWRNEVYGTPYRVSDVGQGVGAKLSHTVSLTLEEIQVGDLLWIAVNSAVVAHADTKQRRYFSGVYASPGTALQAYREDAYMCGMNPDNYSQFAVQIRVAGLGVDPARIWRLFPCSIGSSAAGPELGSSDQPTNRPPDHPSVRPPPQ